MANPTIIEVTAAGDHFRIVPTTLSALKRNEDYLESLLARHPELLELETEHTGIAGPFVLFRQFELRNALLNPVIPDILILCASGHVVIVEVKLSQNPELRNRQVLNQIMDYASAFSGQSDTDLLSMLAPRNEQHTTWEHFIASRFPEVEEADTLAKRFHTRFRRGELHLVIACDKAPPGLRALLSGVARQKATPFELSLVEVTPYVRGDSVDGILFVSKVLLQTEIVLRTAVTVDVSEGFPNRPNVRIETTPLVEIEESLRGPAISRRWSDAELWESVTASGNATAQRLFDLARNLSNTDQIQSRGKKLSPAFGLYLRATADGIPETTRQVFNHQVGSEEVRVYLNNVESLLPSQDFGLVVETFSASFPQAVQRGNREPWMPLSDLTEQFPEFERIMTLISKLAQERQPQAATPITNEVRDY